MEKKMLIEQITKVEDAKKALDVAKAEYEKAEYLLNQWLLDYIDNTLVNKSLFSPEPGMINRYREATRRAFELAKDNEFSELGKILEIYARKWLFHNCGYTLNIDLNDTRTGTESTVEKVEMLLDDKGDGDVKAIARELYNNYEDISYVVNELTRTPECAAIAAYIVRNNIRRKGDSHLMDGPHEDTDFEMLRAISIGE